MPATAAEGKFLIMKTGSTITPCTDRGVDFEDWFAAGMGLHRQRLQVCSLHLGEALPDHDAVAGIVITGSEAYVTDEADWNHRGADYLREAHRREIPILGVCYGHQLLAWSFGGEVHFNPGGREIGTVTIRLTPAGARDPLLGALPNPFQAQVSHQQSAKRLPAGAVLLAESDFEPMDAFRLGHNTWGVQFHPEFNAAVMGEYIRHRREGIAGDGLDPDELLEQLRETPASTALLGRFVALALERRN